MTGARKPTLRKVRKEGEMNVEVTLNFPCFIYSRTQAWKILPTFGNNVRDTQSFVA